MREIPRSLSLRKARKEISVQASLTLISFLVLCNAPQLLSRFREIHLRAHTPLQRIQRPIDRAGGHYLAPPATPPKYSLLNINQLTKRSVAGEFHERG